MNEAYTETNQAVNDALAPHYMQLSVSVRVFSAEAVDRSLSREAEAQHNAVSGAIVATKRLFQGNDKELKAVKAAFNAVRSFVYSKTLPMSLSSPGSNKIGPRLVPVTEAVPVLQSVSTLVQQAQERLDEFVEKYDELVLKQQAALGTAFNPDDYPSKGEVRGLFSAEVVPSPVPAAVDFRRLALPPKVVEVLIKNAESKAERYVQNALEDVVKRTLKELEALHNVFDKKAAEVKGAKVVSTIPDRIATIASLLQAANFSNDPTIESVVKKLKGEFATPSLEQMKSDPALCRKLADESNLMATKLKPLYAAMVSKGAVVPATEDSDAEPTEAQQEAPSVGEEPPVEATTTPAPKTRTTVGPITTVSGPAEATSNPWESVDLEQLPNW